MRVWRSNVVYNMFEDNCPQGVWLQCQGKTVLNRWHLNKALEEVKEMGQRNNSQGGVCPCEEQQRSPWKQRTWSRSRWSWRGKEEWGGGRFSLSITDFGAVKMFLLVAWLPCSEVDNLRFVNPREKEFWSFNVLYSLEVTILYSHSGLEYK